MGAIAKVLMERDGVSKKEACESVKMARERVREGEDPEEVLIEEFGLEVDYFMELM